MWIPILMCLGALALLLGPILLMQPTQRQRREAGLRQAALTKGLRVYLQKPPKGADVPVSMRSIASYCLPWRDKEDVRNPWLLIKSKYAHEAHLFGLWDWQEKSNGIDEAVLSQCLATVPERVVAVASGPQGFCCYWDELGGEGVLLEIDQWLKSCAGQLSKAPLNQNPSTKN